MILCLLGFRYSRATFAKSQPWIFAFATLLALTRGLSAEMVPIGSVSSRAGASGFDMSIDFEALGSNGYQPIELTFISKAGVFTSNRSFQVTLRPRGQIAHDLHFDWTCDVDVPQGVKSFPKKFYVPRYTPWDNLGVEVAENGRLVDSCKGQFGTTSLRIVDAQQHYSVGLLVEPVSKTNPLNEYPFPDVRTLVTVLGTGPLPTDATIDRLPHAEAQRLANDTQPAWVQFRELDSQNLHRDWRAYSQLDIIIVPAPVLARIEQRPEALGPLREWIATGGRLWIYAADDARVSFVEQLQPKPISEQFVPRGELASYLKLSEPNDTSELTYQSYQGTFKNTYNSVKVNAKNELRGAVFERLVSVEHPFTNVEKPDQISQRIKIASAGLGGVITIQDRDPFPGSYQLWKGILDACGGTTFQWSNRHGINVQDGSDDYWNWLIRSVGAAPVKSFLLLNSLFVLVIGPVSYLYFRRRLRLHLLYFSAPLLACAMTICLFVYAIFADGLSTRARVMQVTWWDSKAEVAATWTRQTYFCGMQNRQGLIFDNQVAVYPVVYDPRGPYGGGNSQRVRNWFQASPQQQRLTGDFLPARQQVQYLTLRPELNCPGLQFSQANGVNEVTNHLSKTVRRVMLSTKLGLFTAADLGPGVTVKMVLAPVPLPDDWLDLMTSMEPTGIEAPPKNYRWNSYQNSTRYLNSPPLLETRFLTWYRQLPMNGFMALMDLDERSLGNLNATPTDSYHVMMGELP